jgi:hypothetical protein
MRLCGKSKLKNNTEPTRMKKQDTLTEGLRKAGRFTITMGALASLILISAATTKAETPYWMREAKASSEGNMSVPLRNNSMLVPALNFSLESTPIKERRSACKFFETMIEQNADLTLETISITSRVLRRKMDYNQECALRILDNALDKGSVTPYFQSTLVGVLRENYGLENRKHAFTILEKYLDEGGRFREQTLTSLVLTFSSYYPITGMIFTKDAKKHAFNLLNKALGGGADLSSIKPKLMDIKNGPGNIFSEQDKEYASKLLERIGETEDQAKVAKPKKVAKRKWVKRRKVKKPVETTPATIPEECPCPVQPEENVQL